MQDKIMWKKVNKNSIEFIIENQNKSFMSVIPENSLEISNGLKMLEYIYTEEEKNFFPKDFDFPKDILSIEDRITGFLIRINAYVNILCSLEKIVTKTYKEMRKNIEDLGQESILPNQKEELKKRKEEIETFKLWRDKVFAHTAYSSSKYRGEEDNLSTQLTSLAYFGGTILGYGKKSFQVGGASKQSGEIKSISFPVIDIAENHPKIIEHFKKWEEMFIEILEKFKTIDKKDIMEKNKNIKKIIYFS